MKQKGWWNILNLGICEPCVTPTQARSEDSPAPHLRSLMSPPHQHTPSGNLSSDLGCFNFAALELQLGGTTPQVLLFIWLLPSVQCLSRLRHGAGGLSFPWCVEKNYTIYCRPIQPTTERHTACFQFGAIKNIAAVNIFVQVPGGHVHSFIGVVFSGMKLPGHSTHRSLALVTITKQFSKVLAPIYIASSFP